MKHLKSGMTFFLLSLLGCASLGITGCDAENCVGDPAPKVERCIMNGDGSAQCLEPGEDPKTKLERELENYIAHSPDGYQRLIEWCTATK